MIGTHIALTLKAQRKMKQVRKEAEDDDKVLLEEEEAQEDAKKKRGRGRGRGRGCGRVSKKPAAKAPPEPGICKRPAQAPSSSARPSKKTKPTGEVAEETKSGASKLDSWPNSGSDIFENDVGFGCHCQ